MRPGAVPRAQAATHPAPAGGRLTARRAPPRPRRGGLDLGRIVAVAGLLAVALLAPGPGPVARLENQGP